MDQALERLCLLSIFYFTCVILLSLWMSGPLGIPKVTFRTISILYAANVLPLHGPTAAILTTWLHEYMLLATEGSWLGFSHWRGPLSSNRRHKFRNLYSIKQIHKVQDYTLHEIANPIVSETPRNRRHVSQDNELSPQMRSGIYRSLSRKISRSSITFCDSTSTASINEKPAIQSSPIFTKGILTSGRGGGWLCFHWSIGREFDAHQSHKVDSLLKSLWFEWKISSRVDEIEEPILVHALTCVRVDYGYVVYIAHRYTSSTKCI